VGYVVIIAAILALVFGPGLWVRRVLERYSSPADRYAGTGAQLARYLLNKHGLQSVAVETTDQGDHYDPAAKAVRLTPEKFEGHSLTAITVAAHEVGHAIGDYRGSPRSRACHPGQARLRTVAIPDLSREGRAAR
jgi:Zn-dependent membrane protease YugP